MKNEWSQSRINERHHMPYSLQIELERENLS